MSNQNEFPQGPVTLLSRKVSLSNYGYFHAFQAHSRYREAFTPPSQQLNITTPDSVSSGPPSFSRASEPKRPPNASVVFVNDELEIVDFISVCLFLFS
jgi:hypothetical protein